MTNQEEAHNLTVSELYTAENRITAADRLYHAAVAKMEAEHCGSDDRIFKADVALRDAVQAYEKFIPQVQVESVGGTEHEEGR